MQLFVLAEHENQRAARLLHRESDRLTAEANAQHGRPRRNRFRTMLDLAALTPIRVSRLQGPDVFTVAPVYGHISSKAGFVNAAPLPRAPIPAPFQIPRRDGLTDPGPFPLQSH